MPLTMAQLRNLQPQEIQIDNPHLDPMWEQRLLWMMDHQPEYLLEKMERDPEALRRSLLRMVQTATLQQTILQEEDVLDPDQIQEFVNATLSPPDPYPDAPPLTDEQREKVLAWSRSLGEPDD